MTKRGSKGKQQKLRQTLRPSSKVRTEITSEGWNMYPETLEQFVALEPLSTLAEALGLECHIILQQPKPTPNSPTKRVRNHRRA